MGKPSRGIVKNLMVFDTFEGLFAQSTPKVSINDRFYKVLSMRIPHVRFIYKPNAFLIILDAILRFRLANHQFETGFIRVLHKQI